MQTWLTAELTNCKFNSAILGASNLYYMSLYNN